MERSVGPGVAREIETLWAAGSIAALDDGALLERFLRRDSASEDAFAVLVRRHGPMVLRVCRSVTGNAADAQDAAQVTFLILAREARSIAHQSVLAGWLFGTARRVAARVVRDAVRRRGKEALAASLIAASQHADDPADIPEWSGLYDELARIPDRYRLPLVLCDMEGLSHRLAALKLGCPERTLQTRLYRGRERLRRRLIRRGIAPSAVLVLLGTLADPNHGALSPAWFNTTARLAVHLADPGFEVPAAFATLLKGVTRAMRLTRLKWSVPVVAVAGVVAFGLLFGLGRSTPAGPELVRPLAAQAPGEPVAGADKKADGSHSLPRKQDGELTPDRPEPQTKPTAALRTQSWPPVWCAVFSPDGKTLASTAGMLNDGEGTLTLWRVSNGPGVRLAVGAPPVKMKRWARWVVFNPDGKTLITGQGDGSVVIRSATDLSEKRTFVERSPVNCVALSPNGSLLAIAHWSRDISLWDIARNEELGGLPGHEGGTFGVAFSPDGRTLASCGGDHMARLWDVATGKERTLLAGHVDGVSHLAFSPDGKMLATIGFDRRLRLWDADTGKGLAVLRGHNEHGLCVAFSPDGKTIATSSGRWMDFDYTPGPGEVIVWDVAARSILAVYGGHYDRVFGVAYSPDGKTIASACCDGTVRLWPVPAPGSAVQNSRPPHGGVK